MNERQESVPKKSAAPPDAEERYREALSMYCSTRLTMRKICDVTHTNLSGFRYFLHRYHRDRVLARYGVRVKGRDVETFRLHRRCGQTAAARIKYKAAIEACDNAAYLRLNISQIACLFHLNATSLANQLRMHYPEILERRERERCFLGLNGNQKRDARAQCIAYYAAAIELLRTSDATIPEAAEICGVSASGLQQHISFYHKKLAKERSDKRDRAKSRKQRGKITGNGRKHEISPHIEKKYREAVHLYETTSLTLRQIVEKTHVPMGGLRNHLRTWHPESILGRRGFECREDSALRLSETKAYRKSTAEKYAEAIERLRTSDLPTAKVAAEFGLHPESFRDYLRGHEPELYARQGMATTANGRIVSRRSLEKYEEAIRLYETTSEDLKSIAGRLGLKYNSLGGFIRRNFPEVIERHNTLV